MSSQYSRKNKSTASKNTLSPGKHIKTGLTALQKTLALVGSILSIIVATITISKVLHPETESKKDNSDSPTSTIVKIIEKDSSKQDSNTDTSSSSSSAIPQESSDAQNSSSSENPAANTDTSTSTTPATDSSSNAQTNTTP